MIEHVIAYHDESKHHFHAYAKGPAYLDWATQPAPFKHYQGARNLPLARVPITDTPSYDEVFTGKRLTVASFDREGISRFFQDSLAISAWKQAGTMRWAVRVNPSSGNLHPTEGYFIGGPVENLTKLPGVFHYCPDTHGLEVRQVFPSEWWAELTQGLPEDHFFAALTSIHWREAWKYGVRAYRYCQLDLGHAMCAIAISAALSGWKVELVRRAGDRTIAGLLGLSDFEDTEAEYPGMLLVVYRMDKEVHFPSLTRDVILRIADGEWMGESERLSHGHQRWPAIQRIAEVCWREDERDEKLPEDRRAPAWISGRKTILQKVSAEIPRDIPLRRIIHQRRSAMAFDGMAELPADAFYRILAMTLPGERRVPFYTLPWPPSVHLGLFVHRVKGIPPGLYMLVRKKEKIEELKAHMDFRFSWLPPDGCPEGLDLFLLMEGDLKGLSGRLSCYQNIGADGVFTVSMIAEFKDPLKMHGPWYYRVLHWECGMIGQILYLEAEAAGLQGCGIGCFFDDPVHEVFGLSEYTYQVLYHFAMGGGIEDTRVITITEG